MKGNRLKKILGLTGILIVVCLAIYGVIYWSNSRQQSQNMSQATEALTPKQWTQIKEIMLPHSVFYMGFYNEQFGLAVGRSGVTYYTTDGGVSWVEGVNEANCRFGLDILNENYVWTVGNYGGNRVSTDGGKNLFAVADLPLIEEYPNNLVDILDEQRVVVGSPLRLAYTEDGGYQWIDIPLPGTCEFLVGMSFISLDKGYIMDHQGTVYCTENRGEEWTPVAQMTLVEGIRVNDTPSATMRVNADNFATIVYLDKDNKTYSYQVDLSTENAGSDLPVSDEAWQTILLTEKKYVVSYLSNDGQYLTTYNSRGTIHLFKLE